MFESLSHDPGSKSSPASWKLIGLGLLGVSVAALIQHVLYGVAWVLVVAIPLLLTWGIRQSMAGDRQPQRRVIVQRRFPAFAFLVTSRERPEEAARLIEDAFVATDQVSRVAGPRPDTPQQCVVALRPSQAWSLHPRVLVRINPSVAGANVYVRLAPQRFWWFLFDLLLAVLVLALTWSYTLKSVFAGEFIVSAALLAVAATVLRAVRRAARLCTAAIGDTAPN